MSESKKGKPSPRKGIKLSKTQIEKMREAHPNKKEVMCIETNQIFPTIGEAARNLGLHYNLISQVCNGHRKTTGGLTFRFTDKEMRNA